MPIYEHFPKSQLQNKGGFVDTLVWEKAVVFLFFRDMVPSSKAHIHEVTIHLMLGSMFSVLSLIV